MKKLYSLVILAAAALSANAQVVLTVNGETCDPSETVEIIAEEIVVDYPEWGFTDERVECGTEEPALLNEGSADAEVTLTTHFEDLSTCGFQWCFPQECTMVKNTEESRTGIVEAGKSKPITLEPVFNFGQHATTIVVLDVKEGSKTTTYKLRYVYDERSAAGIKDVTSATGAKAIYDLSGRRANKLVSGSLYIQDGRKFIQK